MWSVTSEDLWDWAIESGTVGYAPIEAKWITSYYECFLRFTLNRKDNNGTIIETKFLEIDWILNNLFFVLLSRLDRRPEPSIIL